MNSAKNRAFQVFGVRYNILRIEKSSTVDTSYALVIKNGVRVEDRRLKSFRIQFEVKKSKLEVSIFVVVARVIFSQQSLVDHDTDVRGVDLDTVYLRSKVY